MGIPATKKPISVPHRSGATIWVVPLSQSNMIRLHAFTRFDPDDDSTATLYVFNGVKMCVVKVAGQPELERVRPKHHRGLDAEAMPDEVAEFVMEDPDCVAAVIQAMHGGVLAARDPNSSRPPAGSTDVGSGRPPSTSTPPDTAG